MCIISIYFKTLYLMLNEINIKKQKNTSLEWACGVPNVENCGKSFATCCKAECKADDVLKVLQTQSENYSCN